jgi:hypothetical protein
MWHNEDHDDQMIDAIYDNNVWLTGRLLSLCYVEPSPALVDTAIMNGNSQIMELILSYGLNIDYRNQYFVLACQLRKFDCVKKLVEMGVQDIYGDFTNDENIKKYLTDARAQRQKRINGLIRCVPMLMLWRKRATEAVFHPSRIDFVKQLKDLEI